MNLNTETGSLYGVSLQFIEPQDKTPLIDNLTGMFDRKYFTIMVGKEIKRSTRYIKPFSLVILSPDQLDQTTEGNRLLQLQLLRKLASEINSHIRAEDTLCRYDAGSFAVVLPETADNGAAIFAQRILTITERLPLFKDSHVTVSAGISAYPSSAKNADDLIEAMERSLEQAQKEGKNRVGHLIKERRRFRRYTTTWKMIYQLLDSYAAGMVSLKECFSRDVSLGGVCFETNQELDEGSKVGVVLHPSLMHGETVELDGVIRWKKKVTAYKYAHGIEFRKLNDDASEILRKALPIFEVRM
jgi:diguanylate cyclase (GGDEF)-like protein